MSIRTPNQPREPQPDGNPYFYGFREVIVRDKNGRRRLVTQPLTREDVLHPQEGDRVTHNSDHIWDCAYLLFALSAQVAHELTTRIFCDFLILWDVPGLGTSGPDIVLIRGLRDPERRRDSFNVTEEGVRPELIIEITSPSTRDVDFNDKRRDYWRAQVPVYVIVDEMWRRGRRHLRIIPFRRGPRAYRRERLGPNRRYWLEAVQLWLGQENGRVALYNAQGQRLSGLNELNEALEQEREAHEQAQHDLQQAQEEIARLREQLRNPPQP